MKNLLIILLLFPICFLGQNLVPNPGFEDNSALPSGYGEFFLSNGWSNVNGVTTGPPFASPDYYHTAGTVGNFFGQIAPQGGNAQMGIGTYSAGLGDWREYISTELTSNLIAGQTYTVQFYLTNGFGGNYSAACNNFGVLFSNGLPTQVQDEPILEEPQIEITDVIYYDNFWQVHTFTYTADDNYSHVTYGNFRDDANTIIQGNDNQCYYFLDGCLVEPTTPLLSATGELEICEGDTATLVASGTGNYVWTDLSSGNVISNSDIIDVFPITTTSYEVTDGTNSETLTVEVYSNPVIDLGVDTILCPGESLVLDPGIPALTYQWQDMSTNSTYLVDEAGLYSVILVDGNGCLGEDEIFVDFIEEYSFDFPDNQQTFCDIDEYVFPLNDLPGGVISCNGLVVNDQLVIDQSSQLFCLAEIGGCVFEDFLDIVIGETPEIDLGADTVLCDGDVLLIDATLPNVTYDWSTGSADPSILVGTPNLYSVTISDFDSDCEAVFEIQVDYIPFPEVNLGADIELCLGETEVLDAFFPGASYLWQDNSTNSSLLVSASGTYHVTTQVGSCFDADTIEVNYNPLPEIELGTDTIICANAEITYDIGQSGVSQIWQDGSEEAIYTIDEQGTYFVTATYDATGCMQTDTVRIGEFPLPTLDFGNDTIVCANQKFLLRPNIEFADSTVWNDGNNMEEFLPISPGLYFATSYNDCGETFDEIELLFEDCSCSIFIPNAITPDADGLNDALSPVFNNCDFFNYSFSIMDRWGQVVFETDNPEEGWNGTQNDESAYYRQTNVYVWVMTFDAVIEGQITSSRRTGHITLIR